MDREVPFDIQIHLRVDRSIARKILLTDVQDETERIWRPYGVRITWSEYESRNEPFPVTALVGWRVEQSRVPNGPLVLGRAFVEPNYPPTRPIRVSVDAMEQTLALRPNAWTSVAGHVHQEQMARALGRVLAHEIGHVLLAYRTHESTGLMRETFTPDQLAQADRSPFALTVNSMGRLRSRIERLRLQRDQQTSESSGAGR